MVGIATYRSDPYLHLSWSRFHRPCAVLSVGPPRRRNRLLVEPARELVAEREQVGRTGAPRSATRLLGPAGAAVRRSRRPPRDRRTGASRPRRQPHRPDVHRRPPGDFLYSAMHRAGYANQPESRSRDDGTPTHRRRITAPVRCAPPANKPTPEERDRCRRFWSGSSRC